MEDVASQYFGVSVSSYQFEELVRDISALAHRKNFGSQELDRTLITLGDCASRFLSLFGANEGRTGFRAHDAFLEKNEDVYRDVLRALELAGLQLELLKSPPEESLLLVARARDLARRLEFWMESGDRRYVYWIERRGRGTFLQATPIECGAIVGRPPL